MSNGTETLNVQLAAGKSVTFRHQVLILDKKATASEIEDYYNGFTR